MKSRSFQEEFWAGEFGNQYVERNNSPALVASNTALFAKILQHTGRVNSVCELGANIGLNLVALHRLLPDAALTGVEINQKAVEQLEALPYVEAKQCSIYELADRETYDLVFTKGVLIHQNPDDLPKAYDTLYQLSNRYIMICEYYNPKPVEVEYRGNKSVLFKRDFAGEMLEKFPNLRLIDYGFIYHRDIHFPGDDDTWFLMEKH